MEWLDLEEAPMFDTSVEGIELHSHHPYALNKLEPGDEIRISIQHQDIYTLPSESFLYLEGKVLKENGDPLPNSCKLTNNAFAFLFDEIRYELCGVEVDRVRNLGITSTLKNMISYRFGSGFHQQHGWCQPNNNNLNIVKDGNFSVCLPLSMLLGFAEDYGKVIINVKQELILVRSRSDNKCYISQVPAEAVQEPTVAKIQISKLSWKIPYVKVDECQKINLMKHLQMEKIISVAFRSWELFEYPLLPSARKQVWPVKTASMLEKPRYVILAFQTKRNTIETDSSLFDHCNLRNVKLYLNSKAYPYDDLNLDFDKNQYGVLYHLYTMFHSSFYSVGKTSLPLLSFQQFKDKAPITVIDCSRQSEILKSGPVDIRLEFESSNAFPPETTAFCLIIHDRVIEYNPLTSIVCRRVTL